MKNLNATTLKEQNNALTKQLQQINKQYISLKCNYDSLQNEGKIRLENRQLKERLAGTTGKLKQIEADKTLLTQQVQTLNKQLA